MTITSGSDDDDGDDSINNDLGSEGSSGDIDDSDVHDAFVEQVFTPSGLARVLPTNEIHIGRQDDDAPSRVYILDDDIGSNIANSGLLTLRLLASWMRRRAWQPYIIGLGVTAAIGTAIGVAIWSELRHDVPASSTAATASRPAPSI